MSKQFLGKYKCGVKHIRGMRKILMNDARSRPNQEARLQMSGCAQAHNEISVLSR